MQQFFLFCTMLIITSEAFSEELHGSKIFKSTSRKTRLAPKLKFPNPDMFGHLNFPMFSVPFRNKNQDYKAPFFVPLRRRGFNTKNCFVKNNRRFNRRKNFRKKIFKKKKRYPKSFIEPDSFIINSPQCFKSSRLFGSEFPVGPQDNFSNFFGDVSDSHRVGVIKNPSQFIVCLYPVFNHVNKRTLNLLKNRRFSALKRQYLINLKDRVIKNKRSANTKNSVDEIAFQQDRKKVAGSENHHKNIAKYKPNAVSPFNFKFDRPNGVSREERNEAARSKYYEDDTKTEKPLNVRLNSYEKLKHSVQDSFLPSPPDGLTHSESHVDVTRPPLPSPKIDLKHPYDVNLYESSLRRDDDFTDRPPETETSSAVEETTDAKMETSTPHDISKLKKILDEVESLLESRSNNKVHLRDSIELGKQDKTKLKKDEQKEKPKEKVDKTVKELDKTGKEVVINENNTMTIKEKIETVALPLLREISEELGNISNVKLLNFASGKGGNDTTGGRCSADGTWKSSVLGLDMTFTTMPNMLIKVKVNSKTNSIINKKWSIHGLTLSKRGGPLMLAAIYPQKRKIASFLGQCKMCKNQDLIFGVWTMYTCGRGFSDLWKAVETKLDILKKQH